MPGMRDSYMSMNELEEKLAMKDRRVSDLLSQNFFLSARNVRLSLALTAARDKLAELVGRGDVKGVFVQLARWVDISVFVESVYVVPLPILTRYSIYHSFAERTMPACSQTRMCWWTSSAVWRTTLLSHLHTPTHTLLLFAWCSSACLRWAGLMLLSLCLATSMGLIWTPFNATDAPTVSPLTSVFALVYSNTLPGCTRMR